MLSGQRAMTAQALMPHLEAAAGDAPRFSAGEHLTVDLHTAVCYETFTRERAVAG